MKRYKKSFFKQLLALFLIAFNLGLINADVIDGIEYTLDTSNKTATISGYYMSEMPKDLVIPSEITSGTSTFSVTKIAPSAFEGCYKLESLSLPGSITQIDEAHHSLSDPNTNRSSYKSAFKGCTRLKTLRLEDGDKELFLGSTYYGENRSHRYIGKGLFADCPLQTLYLGRNINYLIHSYYSDGFSLFPERCGFSAFNDQVNLETIIIGPNVTILPSYIFRGCSGLTFVNLNARLKTIDQCAFEGCSKLESITIPASVTRLGKYYYYGSFSEDCNPNTDDYYYKSVFKGCTSLKKVRFEDGKDKLTLGATYHFVGRGLFADCPLEDIYIGRDLKYEDYSSEFQSTPRYFGYSAFYDQSNLHSVTIGPDVTSLPDYLFYECNNITTFVALPKKPASISLRTFSSYSANLCTLNVAKEAYMTADYWKLFTNVTGMITDNELMYVPQGNNSVAVTKFPGASPEQIIIPSTISDETGSFNVVRVLPDAFKSCEDLTNVSLPSTVTEIGENAFAYNQKLSSVTFNGQKIIGKGAFRNCPSIISLSLPSTLEEIHDLAFYKNTSITSISFGQSLKTIGIQAFADCSALTAIKLPANVETISHGAFENCIKLVYASLGSSLTALGEKAFYNCKVLTEIDILGTIESVGNGAFEKCTSLTLATIGDGVKTFGDNTFRECESLLLLRIPASVVSIGERSFDGCKSLYSVTFCAGPDSLKIAHFKDSPIETLTIGRNLYYSYGTIDAPFYEKATLTDVSFIGDYVTELYHNLFTKCSGISSISLPSSLKLIRDGVFNGCVGLTSIDIPEGVTDIGNSVFQNCNKISEFTLPSSVVSIGDHCFNNCTSLKSVTFKDSEKPSPIKMGSEKAWLSMFNNCPLENLYVGRDLDYYEYNKEISPFFNCDKLVNVIISDYGSVSYLKSYFLFGASSLMTLKVPDTVINIGSYAFSECSSLESIYLSKNLDCINDGLFLNDIALKSLAVPSSVAYIGNDAVGNCVSLHDLRFEDSKQKVTIYRLGENNGMCAETSVENLYIGRDFKYERPPFFNLKSLKNIEFSTKGTVTYLDDDFFNGCSGVKTLNLPESLTKVGDRAFMNMTSLEDCHMFNNVEAIGISGFANDESLNNIVFSTKVSVLSENLFQNCNTLPKFIISPAVKTINNNAFLNTTSLKTLVFENDSQILNIGRRFVDGQYASIFADSPLQTIYLSRWLNYDIEDETCAPFYSQPGLTDLTFGETLGNIGKYLFEKCTAIKSVDIPGIESIGERAFFECTGINNLSLNEGSLSVGEQAFAECSGLEKLKLPSTIETLSDGCFMNDVNLLTIEFGSSVGTIGPKAFSGCISLKELNFPKTLYAIGVESFMGCTSLSHVMIPSECTSLKTIGARAFKDCAGLKWVSLSERMTSLGSGSFEGCDAICYIKSYNVLPPAVSLPNFEQKVFDTATLFVPAESINDYKKASVWREFFEIRPIGDEILVSSLSISNEKLNLEPDETFTLTATVLPEDATDKSVTWTSSDVTVATVDANGLVKAIAAGTCTITAMTADGSNLSASCTITVEDDVVVVPVKSIMLDTAEKSLKTGESFTLTATVLPEDATDKSVTWTSSDATVATVDANGLVKAIAPGTCTITATTADGSNLSASCTITVEEGIVVPPVKEYIVQVNSIYYRVDPATHEAEVIGTYDDKSLDSYKLLTNAVIVATVEYEGVTYDVTSISDLAFNDADNLESITIEESTIPITVSDRTFKSYFNSDLPIKQFSVYRQLNLTSDYLLFRQKYLEEITIAGEATTVSKYAFYGATALKSVTLGEKVTDVGAMAFYECTAITKVISMAAVPPIAGAKCFDNSVFPSATLYVYNSSLDAYKNADIWKNFYDIKPLDPNSGIDTVEQDKPVTVYTISGVLINQAATPDDIATLQRGLYIIDGKKVMIK